MVRFYPKAEQTYELEYRYHAIPPALDASTNIYHYGGAEHSQTIIAAVMDALYRRVRSSNEKQEEFQNRLRQSILHDRRNYQTGNLGQKLRYAEGKDALRDFRENTPTGNITTTFYT
jgi:superoxide dismutase